MPGHNVERDVSKSSAVVLACAMALAACTGGAGKSTIGSTFDHPAPHPGPTWTQDGRPAPSEVIAAAAGPQHCGWQSATFLTVGWPIRTAATTAADARQYIRDPKAVVPTSALRTTLDRHATLPSDASTTGFTLNGITLYFAPSDQDQAAYVVAGSDVERWPRSDPMTLCS
jgi:hypothetical protein